MSLDLSAAFSASTAAYWPTVAQYISNRERIEIIVAAAAPLIEAQVRAQVAHLAPFEDIALTVAAAQVRRGEEPTPNVAAVCVMALLRIARGESA